LEFSMQLGVFQRANFDWTSDQEVVECTTYAALVAEKGQVNRPVAFFRFEFYISIRCLNHAASRK
jgi:hypothetical protein